MDVLDLPDELVQLKEKNSVIILFVFAEKWIIVNDIDKISIRTFWLSLFLRMFSLSRFLDKFKYYREKDDPPVQNMELL